MLVLASIVDTSIEKRNNKNRKEDKWRFYEKKK